jgi:hypothetical protein
VALTTSQLSSFSASQAAAISTVTLQGMSTTQIGVLLGVGST